MMSCALSWEERKSCCNQAQMWEDTVTAVVAVAVVEARVLVVVVVTAAAAAAGPVKTMEEALLLTFM
jgi:hypothetical protein